MTIPTNMEGERAQSYVQVVLFPGVIFWCKHAAAAKTNCTA